MIDYILSRLNPYLGKRVNGRYVVFESDDWGAIRMASSEAFTKIAAAGYDVASNDYESNDALETSDDIAALASVLQGYADASGRNPQFVLNYAVCNPNLAAIKQSGYTDYSFERFTDTYERRYGECYPLDSVVNGYRVFLPQFHCREHLNVARWMQDLKTDANGLRWVADIGCAGTHINSHLGNPYVKAYDASVDAENDAICRNVAEGLDIFADIFGYKSLTAIAPSYLWDDRLDEVYLQHGVEGLQGGKFQIMPSFRHRRPRYHWQGEQRNGLVYIQRNCVFEPTKMRSGAVSRCLADIERAFSHNHPAVICSHRLNYIGYINAENAVNGRKQLSLLLEHILKRWPDVKFITSVELLQKLRRVK